MIMTIVVITATILMNIILFLLLLLLILTCFLKPVGPGGILTVVLNICASSKVNTPLNHEPLSCDFFNLSPKCQSDWGAANASQESFSKSQAMQETELKRSIFDVPRRACLWPFGGDEGLWAVFLMTMQGSAGYVQGAKFLMSSA